MISRGPEEPAGRKRFMGSREVRIQGIGVSGGVAIGPAAFVRWGVDEPHAETIRPEEVAGELARLDQAVNETREEIRGLEKQAAGQLGPTEARIFEAHALMLDDPSVLEEVRQRVRSDLVCVDAIYYQVLQGYIDALKQIDDPYLRERAADIHDVVRRVLRKLAGGHDAPALAQPHVLFAHDLTPSDTAAMDRDHVLGFVTEIGSNTSHTAIVARSQGIPAVVGIHKMPMRLHWGQQVLVDGYNGIVVVDPSAETLDSYEELRARKAVTDARLAKFSARQAKTTDGKAIVLSANIEFYEELELATRNGADGVGLYRTEFFYLDGDRLPTEEEQAVNYGRVARECGEKGVIIRTFDLGGDKLHGLNAEAEPNPFLGWRGIRVSLARPEIFRTQLRAILRASAEGKVRVMYPMISGIEQVREANALLEKCKGELRSEGIPFDEELEVGAMIEVPSAAVIAPVIAREVAFFSLGTNDLVQYTMAVDRVNERVADLYQPYHPAVIRLMKMTIDAAHDAGIWTGVCGELAADIFMTPVLIGLGIDELSVGGMQLPLVKHAVRSLNTEDCAALVAEILEFGEAATILERCRQEAMRHYADMLS